ncbi:AAA family ATPase [Pimelobacter simplex]|uniref:AAA family ATPase n=1 Tax=Nocardioides simplex TaxID=2045 RepID=UPI00190F99AB|nr:AAA family ATPase [Pimelobacter simplex]
MSVQGFRSLADVSVPMGPLTVLVGPNGSGKSNVLNVLRFLVATIRFDLPTAIEEFGGWSRLARQDGKTKAVRIVVEAEVTANAHANAPDRYKLSISREGRTRYEEFTFKRKSGPGRRITVNGVTANIGTTRADSRGRDLKLADEQTTGLSTLPKLAADAGGEGIDDFASFLSGMRVLEPDVAAARSPSRLYRASLVEDASNLADALLTLRETAPQSFSDIERDMRACLPGLDRLNFTTLPGTRSVVVQLVERGLEREIDLTEASFGTVRLLALLTALHDPSPAHLTAIEEIDHGLHPYALDVVVDALRAASERTQILVATHSPTLVNRLRPSELVVCDRDSKTGASKIPAVSSYEISKATRASNLGLGELWFAGVLGGVPK